MLVSKNDDRYQSLRNAIISVRKERGLHQAELAKKLGVSQQFVSKIETGERQLDFIEVIEIARALGIDLNTLIKKL